MGRIIKAVITHHAPLMQHSGRLANPFDAFACEIKKLTSKPAKKKTESDGEMIAWWEWAGGLYTSAPITPDTAADAIVTPTIPDLNVLAGVQAGARFQRKGVDVMRGCAIIPGSVKLDVPGWPSRKTLRAIFDQDRQFVDYRSVVMPSGGRTMRCRPIFSAWSLAFAVAVDEEIIDVKSVSDAITRLASHIGLLEYRPLFGRGVAVVEVLEAAEREAA
jgi:hypothetical protein